MLRVKGNKPVSLQPLSDQSTSIFFTYLFVFYYLSTINLYNLWMREESLLREKKEGDKVKDLRNFLRSKSIRALTKALFCLLLSFHLWSK